jgi:hypothetical protein
MSRDDIMLMTHLPQWRDRAGVRSNGERGAALIMAMVILVMLTFIGLAALSTSSTELFLSSNYRRSLEAFHAAEGMMDAALVDTTNFVVPAGGAGTETDLADITDTNTSNHNEVTGEGTVTYIAAGPPPAGAGMGTKVKANYFVVETTGRGSLGAENRQELVLSRIVPGG